jgi:hypothetical protein
LLLLSFLLVETEGSSRGVDGISWADCEAHLEVNVADLHKRIHSNAYRAQPSRRHRHYVEYGAMVMTPFLRSVRPQLVQK